MRWQYWGFMHYQNIMLCSGVSLSRKNTKAKAVTYKRPMLPLKIWQSNMRNAKKMSIAKKLSNIVHTSTKKIIKIIACVFAIAHACTLAYGVMFATLNHPRLLLCCRFFF